jgi:hypothetical protein
VIPATNGVVRTLLQIEVIFDGPMTGVDASDLLINGVAATNLLLVSPSQFIFEFSQPAPGAVTVAFAAGHGITDTGGNPFTGANWSYTLDPNLPSSSFVLNEVQAVNTVTLRDEDGEYQDWIEIYNRDSVPGSLNGWFLTDNAGLPTQWRFPDVAVPANGYLIVFASGKDRTNVTGRLHSNFNLRREGEYVALLDRAPTLSRLYLSNMARDGDEFLWPRSHRSQPARFLHTAHARRSQSGRRARQLRA